MSTLRTNLCVLSCSSTHFCLPLISYSTVWFFPLLLDYILSHWRKFMDVTQIDGLCICKKAICARTFDGNALACVSNWNGFEVWPQTLFMGHSTNNAHTILIEYSAKNGLAVEQSLNSFDLRSLSGQLSCAYWAQKMLIIIKYLEIFSHSEQWILCHGLWNI